jgi:LruC domain-containing protein
MKRILCASLLTVGCMAMTGLSGNPGNLAWTFLLDPYSSNYDASGIPLVIFNNLNLTPSFYDRVGAALPELRDVRNTNPDYTAADVASDIHLTKDADISVNFVHEGSSFKNSLGYFTYTAATIPKTKWDVLETIVVPNVSFSSSGGSPAGLKSTDTVYVGRFPAGTYVGFVLVSNGYDSETGVKANQNTDWIFYSASGLNSEDSASLKKHSVLLYDTIGKIMVVGVEDTLRTDPSADNDMNDAVVAVVSDPPDAMDTTNVVPLPEVTDRDKDGVLDSNDDFPDDPTRAFNVEYPSGGSWGTLAFEDQWPKQGDYDMNDLVVRYQAAQIEDNQGRIKDLQIAVQIQARGASLPSGFGIELTNVPPTSLESATMTTNNSAATAVAPEAGQEFLTWIFFNNAGDHAHAPAGYSFFNTEAGQPQQDGTLFTLKMTFRSPQSKTTIGALPYNPFIFSTAKRGVEMHLPDHPPTRLADLSLFGTGDDNSKPASARYYKTSKNLPWALHLGESWHHPLEKTMITVAYPKFGPWAESGGTSNLDWYLLPGINPVGVYP